VGVGGWGGGGVGGGGGLGSGFCLWCVGEWWVGGGVGFLGGGQRGSINMEGEHSMGASKGKGYGADQKRNVGRGGIQLK